MTDFMCYVKYLHRHNNVLYNIAYNVDIVTQNVNTADNDRAKMQSCARRKYYICILVNKRLSTFATFKL